MNTPNATAALNFQLYKFKLVTDVLFLTQVVAAILFLGVCWEAMDFTGAFQGSLMLQKSCQNQPTSSKDICEQKGVLKMLNSQ